MRRLKLFGVMFGVAMVASVAALTVGGRGAGPQQPKPGRTMPTRGVTLLVELGLKDSEATGWAGEIKVPDGSVVALRAVGGNELPRNVLPEESAFDEVIGAWVVQMPGNLKRNSVFPQDL